MNNIVRVTLAALAAVLGSAQTLHTSGFDEAFGTPTEAAAELALRTQQIIMEESGLTATADPFGGSWALESLTADIERAVTAMVDEIQERGGALTCIDDGWFLSRLEEAAYADQRAVEGGVRKVVGINVHRAEGRELSPEVFASDPASEARQVRRLEQVRRDRDSRAVATALEHLRQAARSGQNTIEPTIEAVRAYATVDEITNTLRATYGSQRSRSRRCSAARWSPSR